MEVVALEHTIRGLERGRKRLVTMVWTSCAKSWVGVWERVTWSDILGSHFRCRRQCLGKGPCSYGTRVLAMLVHMFSLRSDLSREISKLLGLGCHVALSGPCLKGVGGWVGLERAAVDLVLSVW